MTWSLPGKNKFHNPNKGGDIQVARFCLVWVRSSMGMVDQTRRIILMGKKEGLS